MPDQSAITNTIAAGVQNQDTSSGAGNAVPQGPSIMQRIAFGLANVGTQGQALRDKLNSKYEMERMDKEMKFKLSTQKTEAENQLRIEALKNGGMSAFNTPDMQKWAHKDPDSYGLYQGIAQNADDTKKHIMAAFIAAKMNPELANLPPEAQKMVVANQKAQFEQQKQGFELQKEKIDLTKANVELNKANVDLSKAFADKSDKALEKQQAAQEKWFDSMSKNRDASMAKYNAVDTNGNPKYPEAAVKKAHDAWNNSVDVQVKRAKKLGISVDPTDYKLSFQPGTPGGYLFNRRGTPAMLGPESEAVAQPPPSPGQNTPTGPGAAMASTRNPSIPDGTQARNKAGKPITRKGGQWVLD